MAEVEVPSWLRSLAPAPEYYPTEAEFADPIDYIFRIEREAAQFGICKIVPPYVKAPKRDVFRNLNASLANSVDAAAMGEAVGVGRSMGPARSMGGAGGVVAGAALLDADLGGRARFTTRRQQLGWNSKKARTAGVAPQAVVHKLVWQSGETYTLDQFEAKAKQFARHRLGTSHEVAPLPVEALFWKAALEKAISIEYANDIPGSAFAEPREAPARNREEDEDGEDASRPGEEEEAKSDNEDVEVGTSGGDGENGQGVGCKLSDSAWNMRKVARSPGSLLRFIPDEVPGVTSPMVYIGMLFSWFAWHVEDHELHSLNYLHTGAPKTWYAVPGDAAPALEEVVRVQGYGGQLNAQDAFARLGEKTTVMSPEVLVAAGVPCCRLVQNAGEYVVTFPRAYHLGFSHGFNCGEAANFATPGWLDVAREASVRRAAMKYLPMLSHQQLLYTLAVSLIPRSLFDIACENRSSRQKEKKRIGEEVVKSMFASDVIQQNDLIGKILDIGVARCLLVKHLKQYSPHVVARVSEWDVPSKTCIPEEDKQVDVVPASVALETPASERPIDFQVSPGTPMVSVEEHQVDTRPHKLNDMNCTIAAEQDCEDNLVFSALPRDLSTLPCAACGILCYTGMAIVQPSEKAAATLRPLHLYASGPGSHRSKSVINSFSGVLPGKADKKSADFHMLPTVQGQPLLELEGTTPDVYTDALYEDQTEEPEVWTPELKECPTMYKDCSNDATLDGEFPQSGQASAVSERDEYCPLEVARSVSCVGQDGATLNNIVEDPMEVDKQSNEIISGLGSAASGDLIAQNANCGLNRIESKPVADAALSSLQLLAAAYDGDSDIDECDEIEHGNADNIVGSPLTGPTMHTADLSDLASRQQPASPVGCDLSFVSPSLNNVINSSSPTPKDLKATVEPSEVMMLSPSGSQTLALKGTSPSLAELAEEHLKSGIELDSCEKACNTSEETSRTVIEPSSFEPNGNTKDGENGAREEAKQKSAMPFIECVTCSLPHDSFFDSFEEAALKCVDNGTMEPENSSEKNEILVSCDEKSCALVAPESDLESIEPVGVPCTSLVEAGSLLAEVSSVTTDSSARLGDAPDNCCSLDFACAAKHPIVNGFEDAEGAPEAMQIESSAPNQLQMLKGAARPRMLCLEHAVTAQKSLELIGGSSVIILCHSSFPKVEEQAKDVAAEVGVNHQWRCVPFQQAGDEEYKIITAAVEAEEARWAGGSDWVDQLDLIVHGQSKAFYNDVEIAYGNPSSEESEEPGNRRIWKGRKEKKSLIIGQWCGKGWRADQLHPLLGGRRYMPVPIDNTTTPANLCATGVVSSHVETGRARKIIRPARLAEYTPDGRAPKGESHTKKPSNKRKILLEMSEDEFDEQNSEARRGGSNDGFFTQATLCGSSGDSVWQEVPIASTDSLLSPLDLSEMAEEKDRDDLVSFAPQPVFRSENGMHLNAGEANTSANISLNNVVSQSCAVVGGFLQRGAKLQAQAKLQKLCRQLSTPVSVSCTPLTTPSRFASWVKPSHKRISATKLVNRLKRKPATELSWYSKKQKFVEAGDLKNRSHPLRRENGDVFASDVLFPEDVIPIADEEAKEDSQQDHNALSDEDKELYTDDHSDTPAEEDENHEPEKLDGGFQPVQDCNCKFLGNTDSSPSKSNFQQGHCVEDTPKESWPADKAPNIHPNSISISMYCTESLPQSASEQITQELGAPSAGIEPVLVPRRGRVRGKRMKTRHWKSCLQLPNSEPEDESLFPACDEYHTSGDSSYDPLTLEPKLSMEGHDSETQADPDFFPYLNCLTSSTPSVRRRHICTPSMAAWGVDKDGNGDSAEGSADHSSVQQHSAKTNKRKNGQSSAKKRGDDLEGEFQCDMKGCSMAFDSVRDLQLHKRNLCTWKGCGKRFLMHKYLMQHRRVHLDERPLKCPYKNCTKTFKWAWARTEHLRIHNSERPYVCDVSGCGQTFRFVSDFSRHKRKTGHRPT